MSRADDSSQTKGPVHKVSKPFGRRIRPEITLGFEVFAIEIVVEGDIREREVACSGKHDLGLSCAPAQKLEEQVDCKHVRPIGRHVAAKEEIAGFRVMINEVDAGVVQHGSSPRDARQGAGEADRQRCRRAHALSAHSALNLTFLIVIPSRYSYIYGANTINNTRKLLEFEKPSRFKSPGPNGSLIPQQECTVPARTWFP